VTASSPNEISVVDQHDAGERPAPVPTTGLLAGLDRLVEAVALALFTVMLVVVLTQVLARFSQVAVIWTEELARVLLILSSVLAMAVCVRRREHIVVDFLLVRMRPSARRWLLAAFDVAILLFLFVWLRGALRLAELNWGTIYVTVPWIAVSHVYLVEALSIVLMMIFVATDLAARLRGRRAP
jgi:TRAP-type C4-dicarboxylate transport system permease small subunit